MYRNSHASGVKARATCDRCGFTYNHEDLQYETVNRVLTYRKVCPTCFDEDHPQLWGPLDIKLDDPKPLHDPRPDPTRAQTASYFGWKPVGDHNSDGLQNTTRLRVSVGSVTVVTNGG